MEQQNYENTNENQGSIVRGLIGAIIGAVIGAVLWAVIAIGTEKIYSIVGFLIGLIVGFGYDLFKGRKGAARMVIVAVCVILSVVSGIVAANIYLLHDGYREECDFIATATKQELVDRYCTEEELAMLESYPAVLRQRMIDSFEVEMPGEEEFIKLCVEDPEFTSGVAGDCVTSAFFALLGSYALILNNGKIKKQRASDTQTVDFDEAALDLPTENDEASAEDEQAQG